LLLQLFLKDFLEIFLTILRDLFTSMAIENAEYHGFVILDLEGNMSVLHTASPALHCAGSPVVLFILTWLWILFRNRLV
jgi:hypothetical protein